MEWGDQYFVLAAEGVFKSFRIPSKKFRSHHVCFLEVHFEKGK